MKKSIVIQYSSTCVPRPVEEEELLGDNARVIIRDLKTREEKVIFTGREWDEKSFEAKKAEEERRLVFSD